jgi:Holliday junction resolvase
MQHKKKKPAAANKGGRASRDKGNRAERAIVKYLQDRGFKAERVPLSGAAGGSYVGDIILHALGIDLCTEVKCRANGFSRLYDWLEGRDLLVIKADRRAPLLVLPFKLAADIVAKVAVLEHSQEK